MENISFRYPKAKAFVINAIDLTFYEGERIGIIGGNGSGKSTLTKLILGIFKPTQGKISLLGKPVSWTTHFPRLGYIGDPGHNAEQLGLPTGYTVRQILETICRLEGNYDGNIHLNELVLGLELDLILDRKTSVLSTGERKRVMICLTFLRQPDFIILDEPFDGLDAQIINYIRSLMTSLLARKHLTIFYIAHNIVEIDRYTDKVFLLKEGSLLPQPLRLFEGTLSTVEGDTSFQEKTGQLLGRIVDLLQVEEHHTDFNLAVKSIKN